MTIGAFYSRDLCGLCGSVHFEKFNEFRYLIGPAGGYYYLVQIEYKKILENFVRIECHSFKTSFFKLEKNKKKNREKWFIKYSGF